MGMYEDFAADMIRDKGLQVGETTRQQMVADLVATLKKRVGIAMAEALSPADRKEYERMIKKNIPREQRTAFLLSHVDANTITVDTLMAARKAYLGRT